MKKRFIFRFLCMVMVWVYSAAVVQAGQVVTQSDRALAKKTLRLAEEEKKLATIGAANTVAVLYYHNATGREDLNALEKGLAIMLITDLAKIDRIQVVERTKIQALLDEMALGASGLVEQGTAPKVGKMLGAYYLSTGDIAPGQTTEMRIRPTLLDVPFETVTPQPDTTGNLRDLFVMEKEILFAIIKQLDISLSERERDDLRKPLAASTAAALAFFIGVDLSDKGRYAEAATMYKKAIMEDKNFGLAQDALQELKTLGLTGEGQATSSASAPEKVVEEEGGSGGTIALVTLGALAVGGGVALALSSGGDDDSSDDAGGPVIVSTVPTENAVLNTCESGAISFTFNKAIHNCAAVQFTDSISSKTNYAWIPSSTPTTKDTVLTAYYSTGRINVCGTDYSTVTMTATVSGCQDSAGNTMATTQKKFRSK